MKNSFCYQNPSLLTQYLCSTPLNRKFSKPEHSHLSSLVSCSEHKPVTSAICSPPSINYQDKNLSLSAGTAGNERERYGEGETVTGGAPACLLKDR